MIKDSFWKGKKVFLTGHTGFKGSWLAIWLNAMGAKVTGYALKPPTKPSIFELCKVDKITKTIIADIRDKRKLEKSILNFKPEIIIHMAAQPLVRESYKNPHETYETNIMGTVNLLEAARKCKTVKAIVNITTDKCYENKEHLRGYKEDEPMGGYDPYSSSKACSEIVSPAYRNSFFNPKEYKKHGIALATARAGNVIGGGDWADDRLIPDIIKAISKGKKVLIRNPKAIRPWQYVLEPLSGYLALAEKLYKKGNKYAGALNFGPKDGDAKPVEWIVKRMCAKWGNKASSAIDKGRHPHEAHYLKLNCLKAKTEIGWGPKWNLAKAIDKTIEWTLAYKNKEDLHKMCLKQIKEYMNER
ncbi:MAG: CDP-glucose 4,6-dehydratase [Elusimicrobia bacterium]|nr:CDP-glucose 4,6-dehydratase [Elusimicrobiota bacterium]